LFRLPDEYEARALLKLRPTPTMVNELTLKLPSLQSVVAIVKYDELLLQVAKELQPCYPKFQKSTPIWIVQWLKCNLKASVIEDMELLEVRLPSDLPPDRLRDALDLIITLTKLKLASDLKGNHIDLEPMHLNTSGKP